MKPAFIKIFAVFICLVITTQFSNCIVPVSAENKDISLNENISRESNYAEIKNQYPTENTADEIVTVTAEQMAEISQTNLEADGSFCINLQNEDFSFSCNFPKSGRYWIKAKYKIGDNVSSAEVIRSIKINGEYPFSQAQRVCFPRYYEYQGEVRKNASGDEIRPGNVQNNVIEETFMYDAGRFSSNPLEFFFQSGNQTITIGYVNFQLYLYSLSFIPASEISSYSDLSSNYEDIDSLKDNQCTFQAEESVLKVSDAGIRMESNSDPSVMPQSLGYKKLNVIGGRLWRKTGQSVTYKFNAEKSGYYKISIRFLQNWNDGIPSFRRIEIDNNLPYKELEAYKFNYDKSWQTEVLNAAGEEMLFYLEAGEHTLTMTVVLGPLSEIISEIYDDMLIVSDMIQSVNKLTGFDADPNYDYDFFKNIPTLEKDLKKCSDSFLKISEKLDSITSKNTSVSGNFKSMAKQFQNMVENPFSIAKQMDELTNAQTNLGNYYSSLAELPMMMDEFSISTANTNIQKRKANLFEKMYSTIYNLAISFSKDYNQISGIVSDDIQITDTINVWIARGTEWAETLKYLADANFTEQNGILVNMNIVPSSQLNTGSANVLLLSLLSGTGPDVAMGVSSTSPVEFAIRDSVVDLRKFEDFDKVKERFLDKIFIPYTFNGGVYAIPETVGFNCLFYRKDIFERYSYSIPNTWDELKNDLLPMLYKNGSQFYMPHDYATFLFQNDGKFYSENGLKSALDSPMAYDAFEQMTSMFTHYGVPVSANFLTRFRTGEMPVGIGGFPFYIQLCTAAPELMGNWDIALLPGTAKADGTINRASGGIAGECDIIISKDEKKQKSAWEFLKWWSSSETQIDYANELESSIGVEARWNSANLDAFTVLNWSDKERSIINEMWRSANETPVVLGSYYTSRYINNAFNSVVVSGTLSPRDALEDAVKAINRELISKQTEYGVLNSEN